jgi:hypothetical protein
MTDWPKTYIEWTEGDTAFISVPFTWDLQAAHQRAAWLTQEGYHVRAGGPAVSLMPEYMADVAEIGGKVDAITRHNPQATFTSRGCIRRCSFCAVPKIEGELRELDDWLVRPIVCDNNLLACSRRHFQKVIDQLRTFPSCDIQGVDARLVTDWHAELLAGLNCKLRLALDDIAGVEAFRLAFLRLRNAGVPKSRITVYVLIGHDDTPEDAAHRFNLVRSLGAVPLPMRYNPLDALRRDEYVGPNWTDRLLRAYMRYWWRCMGSTRFTFEEWLEVEV